MKRFEIHSHSHMSNFRLKDCIIKPEKLVERAKEVGLAGIALTDHETVAGAVAWNDLARENPDIKLAIGNEIYLTNTRDMGQKYYHCILIAKDKVGFKQLRELSSYSWMNSYYDRGMERVPTLKEELSAKVKLNPGHIIATSACLGGELSTKILEMENARKMFDTITAENAKSDIVDFVLFMKDLFNNDFYFEVAPGKSKEQIIVNKKMIELAQVFNVKIVLGCDAHYLKKEDRYVHKAFLTSQEGEREIDLFYEYSYLQSEQEIIENLQPSIAELYELMCENSMEIYDKIKPFDLRKPQQIPHVDVKDYPKRDFGVNNPEADEIALYPALKSMFTSDDKVERYWINECWNALEKKFNDSPLNIDSRYLKELEEEAEVKRIVGAKLDTNMFRYPILLQHYMDLIWDSGSTIGVGRGSACSALNHYLLGITQLDPIQWDFPFFRYMNRDTEGLGDIDIDISPSKRPMILQRIRDQRSTMFNVEVDELSKKNLGCTLIATYGTETTKSAVLSACFQKGTKVQTPDGEKNIEEIQAGDFVKTKNGYEQVITPTIFLQAPNYKLKTKNSVNKYFICTENHEILTIPFYRRTEGTVATKEMKELFPSLQKLSSTDKTYDLFACNFRKVQPQWKAAKDIQENDYGLIPIDTVTEPITEIHWKNDLRQKFGIGISEKILVTEDFCELIGIWLAEGSINKCGSTISFTIHQKEKKLKNRIISLMWKVFQLDNVTITTKQDSQAMTIAYSSSQLAQFFFQLFDNAGIWREKRADTTRHHLTQWNKKLPSILKHIDPALQMQIVKGWFLGNGYAAEATSNHTRNAKITTVSKQLAQDMLEIFHRNFIVPSVDIEERSLARENKCDCYNLVLYGEYASILYRIKYKSETLEERLEFPLNCRRNLDIPVLYGDQLFLKAKLQATKIDNQIEEVYCLKMPHENFLVNNIVVHNCRGYRSETCPDGIDNDTAQYLSSLIPAERGSLWSLHDTYYGNEEKGRKPVASFIREINQYPGLFDIMLGIEGLVKQRGSHASGVILFDEDPYDWGCFMKTPSGEIITQYDLHMCEAVGGTKLDILVTEVQDKLTETIRLLQENGEIESNLSLREAYNKYFHPDALPIENSPRTWKAIQDASVIDLFQLDSEVGRQGAKKVKPKNMQELSATNGVIRLMTQEKGAETPLEKYVRFKNNAAEWEKEMTRYGLTLNNRQAVRPYLRETYGIGISQEQLMRILMDKNVCNFTLKEANAARKVVSKKKMNQISKLRQQVYEKAVSREMADYIWDSVVGVQLG